MCHVIVWLVGCLNRDHSWWRYSLAIVNRKIRNGSMVCLRPPLPRIFSHRACSCSDCPSHVRRNDGSVEDRKYRTHAHTYPGHTAAIASIRSATGDITAMCRSWTVSVMYASFFFFFASLLWFVLLFRQCCHADHPTDLGVIRCSDAQREIDAPANQLLL